MVKLYHTVNCQHLMILKSSDRARNDLRMLSKPGIRTVRGSLHRPENRHQTGKENSEDGWWTVNVSPETQGHGGRDTSSFNEVRWGGEAATVQKRS